MQRHFTTHLQLYKFLCLVCLIIQPQKIYCQYFENQQQHEGHRFSAFISQSDFTRKISDVSRPLQESYTNLPPKGKFATGAVAGFTTIRLMLNTATRFLKIGGAVFLLSEAFHASGLLDDVDLISDENEAKLHQMKHTMLREADKMRLHVREKYLNLANVRSFVSKAMDNDVLVTTGFATGAAIGLIM